MNDQGETAAATSGSDSADESAYDEAAAGGEHDDDEAGASAQAVQDEAYAASSVMDAMLGAEDKQGGGKEKRMADEEPAIEHLEHYRNCGDCSPHAYFSSPSPSRREILLAPPVLCVCAQEGRTDCAPAATPWTCAASHPARPSCLAAYPRSAAPALREFCALLECVYCVCPGLGKALQEALDELKSVALPLHSPCVGPCTG
jgi:hypothetical protein